MLTSLYDAHNNNKNRSNDKRVDGIAHLCLSAVLNIFHPYTCCTYCSSACPTIIKMSWYDRVQNILFLILE